MAKFVLYQSPKVSQIKLGMALEANRTRGDPSKIEIAAVKEINENGHLLISFNLQDEEAQYWAKITDENLHPPFYCSTINQILSGKICVAN